MDQSGGGSGSSSSSSSSKAEIERLSKENFNLKLRLHYFEEQQGESRSPSAPSGASASSSSVLLLSEQVEHYRNLVEEAKAVISDLQDTLTQTQEDLLFATNEAEDARAAAAHTRSGEEKQEAELVARLREELAREQESARAASERGEELRRDAISARAEAVQTARALQQVQADMRARQESAKPTPLPSSGGEEVAELKRALQQAKAAYEVEVTELRRALQQQQGSNSSSSTGAGEELERARQEIGELRRALLQQQQQQRPPTSSSSDSNLYTRLKQAETRATDLQQALASQQRQHEAALLQQQQRQQRQPPTLQPSLSASLVWEQVGLRFAGSTEPADLVRWIQSVQTQVREWELAAARATKQPQQQPAVLLPSAHRVQLAENLLREATERLEKLEGQRSSSKHKHQAAVAWQHRPPHHRLYNY